jgi:hypothetical protein
MFLARESGCQTLYSTTMQVRIFFTKLSIFVIVICANFPRWKVRGSTYDQSRAQVHRSRKMDAASHLQVILSGTNHLQVILSGNNHLQVIL